MKTLQDIQHHIIKLSKSPNVPDADDSTLVVVLSELIHDYQTRLRDEQLAMLYGIAAALLRRVPLPVPDVVMPDSQRGYTPETVARHIRCPSGANPRSHRNRRTRRAGFAHAKHGKLPA